MSKPGTKFFRRCANCRDKVFGKEKLCQKCKDQRKQIWPAWWLPLATDKTQKGGVMINLPGMPRWKDGTSYSQGETDRTPRTWALRAGCFRLSVTRHNYYPDDAWCVVCKGVWNSPVQLNSKDIDEAKHEAVLKLLAVLKHAMGQLAEVQQ